MKKTLLCAALSLFALSGYAQTAAEALTAAQNRANWSNSGTCTVNWGMGGATATNGVTFFERYEANKASAGVRTEFSTAIANGNYFVTMVVTSQFTPNRGWTTDAADGAKGFTQLVVNNSTWDVPIGNSVNYILPGNSYIIPVHVTDGRLNIKIENLKAGGGNWITWFVTDIRSTSGEAYVQDFNNNLIGWSSTTGAQNRVLKDPGEFPTQSYENWNGSAYTGKMYTRQNVVNGRYRVSLDVLAKSTDNKNVYFFANTSKIPIPNTNIGTYTTEINVTNGVIEFGLGQDAAVANWLLVDNAKITDLIFEDGEAALANADYANVVGNERGELRAAIDSKDVARAHTAYDAFIAAKASYDAWVAKKVNFDGKVYNQASAARITAADNAKLDPTTAAEAANRAQNNLDAAALANALLSHARAEGIAGRVDKTASIVNANAQANDGWTNVAIPGYENYTFDFMSNQCPTVGDHGVTRYWDKYDGDGRGFGSVFQQTISVEPGIYRVAAFGRGLQGEGVFPNLNLTAAAGRVANQSTMEGCHTEQAIANNGDTGEMFGNGWNIYFVDVKVPTDQISIGLEQTTKTKGAWWGITNFTLVKIGDVTEQEKTDYANSSYPVIVQKLLDNPEYTIVTGTERDSLTAIKDNATATDDEFIAAINAFKAAKGAYQNLVTAQATLKATLDACPDASADAKTVANEIINHKAATADDAVAYTNKVVHTKGYLRYSNARAEGRAGATIVEIANPNILSGTNNWDMNGITFEVKPGTDWKGAWTDNIYKDKYPEANYLDKWVGDGNYEGTVSQTVTLTPGTYRLSAFIRGAKYAYTKFNLKANTASAAFPTLDQTVVKAVNATDGAGGEFGMGWDIYSLDITVPTNSLTIAVDINANGNGGKWTSMTGFHLVKLAELSDAEKDAAIAKLPENPATVLNDEAYKNVTGTERTALAAAVAAKDVIALESALPAFKAAKTDYDAYASHKAAIAALDCPDATETLRKAVADLKAEPTTAAEAKTIADSAKNTIPAAKLSHARAEGRAARVDKSAAIKNANASAASVVGTDWSYAMGTDNREAPDSKWGVTNYFDKNGSNFNINFTQEVAVEPGVYRVAAFMRAADDKADFAIEATPVTTLDANATDLKQTKVMAFGSTGGYYGNGWDIYYVDVAVPTNKIKLGAHIKYEPWSWYSFSNFTLVKIGDVSADENAAFAAKVKPAVDAVLADAQYNNVTGEERTNLEAALANNNVSALEGLVASFTAAKGAYDAFVAAKPALDENFADASKTLTGELASLKAGPATAAQATTMTARIPAFVPEARLSHARAEGTRTATVVLVNATNPSNVEGWTITDVAGYTHMNFTPESSQGAASYGLNSYFNNSATNPGGTLTQNVAVEPGRYRLSAFTRGQKDVVFQEYALIAAPYNANVTTTFTKGNAKNRGLKGGDYGDNGWNVAYVDVVVPTTTMTVGMSIISDANEGRWLSFGNFTLAKIGDVTAEEIAAYNAQVKSAGEAVLNDAAYVNVTGKERVDLVAALAGTDEAPITNAVTAFKAAKGAYDSLVAEKAALEALKDKTPDALSTLIDEGNTLRAYAVSESTTAAQVSETVAAIRTHIPTAKLSHARAEGREGRVDKSAAIKNANASDGINGWNKADIAGYNAANFTTPNGEAPNTAKWGVDKYFDANGTNYGAELTQEVAVEPGVYRLAAFMRGSGNFVFDDFSLIGTPVTTLDANATDLQKAGVDNEGVRYGNRGGYFGSNVANPASYGWDIYYLDIVVPTNKVKIGARVAHNNKDSKWLGFSNFTLVKIGDVTAEQKAAFADKVRPAVDAVLADAQYANVTGGERKAVVEALAANEVATVEAALPAFTAAKGSYNEYVNTVARLKTLNYVDASADRKAEVAAVLAAPADAADANTKTAKVSLTYARAKLSHARAEGREGRKVVALVNPDALQTADTDNGWITTAINGKADDCTWTYMSGQRAAAEFGMEKYFDQNGNGRGREMLQQVTVEPGVYRVAAFMRGNNNTTFDTFVLEATPVSAYSSTEKYVETPVNAIGDKGGDFGCAAGDVPSRGWDIYYVDVVVPSKAVKLGAKVAYSGDGWFSFSNFSLVKIGEVTDAQRKAYRDAIYNGGLGDLENAAEYAIVPYGGEEKNALAAAIDNYDEDAIAAAVDVCKTAVADYKAWELYKNNYSNDAQNVTSKYPKADQQKAYQFEDFFTKAEPKSANEAKTTLVNAQRGEKALEISDKIYEGVSDRRVVKVGNPKAELGIFEADPDAANARWTGDASVMQIADQGLDLGTFTDFTKSFESNCAEQESWNTNFTQTLDLDAGFYMLSCMMRGEGTLSKYRLAQKAGLTLPTDNTPTANNYSNAINPEYDGWKLVIIEFQMVKKGPATFGVQAEATAPNSKINFSNFRLSSSNSTVTGVESVSTEAAEAEYYDLNGYRVNPENLVPGLYIVRQGDKVTKVLVK